MTRQRTVDHGAFAREARVVDPVPSWSEATEFLKPMCEEGLTAEEELRVCVREAFIAGLTFTPISEATGLSTARIYQMVI